MPRLAHAKAHPECPWGVTTWTACDQAAREARGRCRAMTEAETECSNWAVEEYEERGYCGQHYGSIVNRAIARKREEERRAGMAERIDAYLAWRETHPSVWDRMAPAVGVEPSASRFGGDSATQARRRGMTKVLWSAKD